MPFWIWVATILAVTTAAFRFGRISERLGAAALLSAWLASFVIARVPGLGYGVGVALLDVALLGVLIALALKSSRYWPLWAAGFHLVAVMTHWAHQLDSTLGAWTYQTAGIIWGYLPLVALSFGTWGAWRERSQLTRAGEPISEPDATLR